MDAKPFNPTQKDADRLLRRLSSFWRVIFGKRPQLAGLYLGRAQAAAQAYLDFLEAYSCAVFRDIPVFHKELWRAFPVLESALTNSPIRYGEGAAYGDGTVYGSASSDLYMKLPDRLKDVAFLHDDVVNPRATYCRGVDFQIEDGTISFMTNPFDDDRLAPAVLYEDGVAVDRGLTLWAQGCDMDSDFLIAHLGAALKLYLPSSETAKRIMVALADLYTRFPSVRYLNAFLAALVDAPVADAETVEAVVDAPGRCVVTDRHVYPVPPGAGVIVAPGDVLRAGDMLTDAVKVIELAYETPGPDDFPAIAGKRLLTGEYSRDLLFRNITSDSWMENGKFRFEVVGADDDVLKFWEAVDAKGGLPGLGGRVNPAEVIFDCLRGNGICVRLNAAGFGAYANPQLLNEFLRRALSPAVTVLSFIEAVTQSDDEACIAVADETAIFGVDMRSDGAGLAAEDTVEIVNIANC